MAKVGMACPCTSAAATGSCVDSGLDAQRAMSAPPALSVSIRLAVSVVTWRQAPTFTPRSGCSCLNLSRIKSSTGISRAAQSISSWPCLARPASRTSPWALIAFELDFTVHLVTLEQVAPLEVDQLDQELAAYHHAAHRLDQLADGPRGAAGGDQVVDDEHPLAPLDGVFVDVQDVAPILQLVLDGKRLPGQLARLPDGDEAGAQLERHAGAENEATRLHGGNQVHLPVAPAPGPSSPPDCRC